MVMAIKIKEIKSLNSEFDYIIKNTSGEERLNLLRELREKECYAYVNRGELWYKRLTENQKQEVDAWYQQWLDVTITLIEPIKPSWIR